MLLLGDCVMLRDFELDFDLGEEEPALCNLEGPLLPYNSSFPTPPKAGPRRFSHVLPVFGSRGVYILANNHFMDYGEAGAEAALTSLRRAGARWCGWGATEAEARKPLLLHDPSGARVGLLACCDAQFGGCGFGRPGVAQWGPWVYEAIHLLREEADFVLVSCHGGAELSPWPYPELQDFYRSLVDAGADVIHGHHSHLAQGCEEYRGGLICYGLGNFATDDMREFRRPPYNNSLAVRLRFKGEGLIWEIFPLRIRVEDGEPGVRRVEPLEGDDARRFQEEHLSLCNQPLTDRPLLEALWQELALRYFHLYGDSLWGWKRENALKTWAKRHFFPSKHSMRQGVGYTLRYHLYSCDAHRRMMETALAVLCGAEPDLRNSRTAALADRLAPETVRR